MVVVPKKDNSPWRTVNFKPLNQYNSRQTHHTVDPFHQVTSVPKDMKKSVLVARAFFSEEVGKLIPRPVACRKLLTDQIVS